MNEAVGKNGIGPPQLAAARIYRPGDAGFKERAMGGITAKERGCVMCGKSYVPTGNAQKRCPDCMGKVKPPTKSKAEKPAAPVVAAAIASLRTKEGKATAKVTDSAFDTQVGGDHYRQMAIQPVEFIAKNKLGFCAGNVIKYVCRHAVKGGAEDLDKAIHYLQLERETLYGKAVA